MTSQRHHEIRAMSTKDWLALSLAERAEWNRLELQRLNVILQS